MLTFVPVVPINIPPHKCVKSAKTRRYLRDSRDSLAAERSPKKLDWTSEAHHTHHNTTTQTSTKHTQSNNYTHDKQPKTKKATTFFLSGHIKLQLNIYLSFFSQISALFILCQVQPKIYQ